MPADGVVGDPKEMGTLIGFNDRRALNMAKTTYTGKFKKGQRVLFGYYAPATSCCENGTFISGAGKITGTQEAEGTTMYVIDNGAMVFEFEINHGR